MLNRISILTLIALGTVVLAMPPTAHAQTTWHVDDNAPNDPGPGDPSVSDPLEDGSAEHPFDAIQEGIDAASNGDTVLVLDGTYTGPGNKELDCGGKAITVRSASGNPTLCIIDCEGEGRGFYFHSSEGADSIVEGLTIIDGWASADGGGVYCDYSSPTLTNCTISGNSAGHGGGGIYCNFYSNPTLITCTISGNAADSSGGGVYCNYTSNPTLTDCTISGNAADSSGGGIYCYGSSPTLTNCTISGNAANSSGGGVYCSNSSPTLTNCTISGNSAYDDGGGVCCSSSNPTLTNCTISGNSATGGQSGGGGIYCHTSSPTLTNCAISGNFAGDQGGGAYCKNISSPTLTNCTISGNSASADGGGVYCSGGSPALTNCTISGNTTIGFYDCGGGGIYCYGSSPTLTNCTISGNSANDDGGGVYCYYSSPTLTNCILWGDTPREIYVDSGEDPIVTYCNVQGGWDGEGNIDGDPQFAFDDDLHLMPGSPCIDAGTNDPPGGLPADDLDGNARPLDGDGDTVAIADMGAFEFNTAAPSRIALNSLGFEFYAPEGGDNPLDQTLSLRNCGAGTLNWEVTGQPAWLTVIPLSGESNGEVDQVTLSVDISGLPSGSYAAVLAVADPQAVNSPREVLVTLYVNTTLYVPGDYSTIQAAIDAAIPADVVEIANGTYVGAGNKDLDFGGKAITVRSASGDPALCIINCEGTGRGFYFYSGEEADSIVEGLTITDGSAGVGSGIYCRFSSPTLTNCTINGNVAYNGGGVYCYTSNLALTNCTISGNLAGDHGAGGYCKYNSSPTLTNCTISGNAAGHGGGGFYCGGGGPTLTHCTISGNSALSGGGVWGNPTLTNCTISGNSADYAGGGVYCQGYVSSTLTNCTISGNSAHYHGGGVYCGENSSSTLTNCTISGNSANGEGGGVYCSGNSVMLTNSTINGNLAYYGGGVYCYYVSPTLTNCTISGNSANGDDARGGGVYCYGSSSNPTVANCILWGDTPQEIWMYSGSPSVTYCNVQGGWTGEGNIDADPLFVDPDGPDDDPNTWQDNDYRLGPGSPCIDAADNTAVPPDVFDLDDDGDIDERIPFDLDGNARFVQDPFTDDTGVPDPPRYRHVVDMGAYEYQFCFGDLDGDDVVGLADLAQLLGSYGETSGMTYYDGDLDDDGDVDLADLAELLGAYGDVCE